MNQLENTPENKAAFLNNHLPEVSNMVDIEEVRKVLMQNEFRIINGLLVGHIINQIRELKANN